MTVPYSSAAIPNPGQDGSALTITTGTAVPYVAGNGGCTLTATTFFFPLGNAPGAIPLETALASAHLKWGAVIVATLTLETCNFTSAEVSDFDTTAGNWIQENPPDAYIGITGGTVVGCTITVPGGSAGGCMIHAGNLGSKRARIKVVVATGGVLACVPHGKAGN